MVLASIIRQEKEIKSLLIGKDDIENNMIIYTENLKTFTEELPEQQMSLGGVRTQSLTIYRNPLYCCIL